VARARRASPCVEHAQTYAPEEPRSPLEFGTKYMYKYFLKNIRWCDLSETGAYSSRPRTDEHRDPFPRALVARLVLRESNIELNRFAVEPIVEPRTIGFRSIDLMSRHQF
jgi:hypothetical protein